MNSGLEGIVAAETVLTHVDGARGIWWLRGYGLAEIIGERGYEGATALLWEGFAGEGLDRETIRRDFAAGRAAAFARLPLWLEAARRLP
ncbi:MAG TPA: citrate/2-methylcitrate synthase, partial [Stellaceae bacterium]|nr:citrate/2-methylcitrate synthase [Stellaceae bacterium]